jgi:hypothetical protein
MLILNKYLGSFHKTWKLWVETSNTLSMTESHFSNLVGAGVCDETLEEARRRVRLLNVEETRLRKKMRRQLFTAFEKQAKAGEATVTPD